MSNELATVEQHAPLVPYNDLERMAAALVDSHLFGIQTKQQAIAIMLVAQAEGLHPATAARDYDIIQGKPSMKTNAMLARFQQAGGRIKWNELTDSCASATFEHPQCAPVTIDWDMKRADAAGLKGRDMWRKYPRQMLRSRVISEGIRSCFPGVLNGMYCPEEVQDFEEVQEKPRLAQRPAADDEDVRANQAKMTPRMWVVEVVKQVEPTANKGGVTAVLAHEVDDTEAIQYVIQLPPRASVQVGDTIACHTQGMGTRISNGVTYPALKGAWATEEVTDGTSV